MMYDYDKEYVQELTALTELQRRALTAWYSRQPESIRLEAHRLQTDLIRQRRSDCRRECLSEFTYAMLLVATQMMKSAEDSRTGRLTIAQARRISEIRIAREKARQQQKECPIRHLVEVRFFEEIKRLREQEGFSWRQISDYLARHYRRRISHAYLQRIFQELQPATSC